MRPAGGKVSAPRQAARSTVRTLSTRGPIVTQTLIGINVALFVLELATGGQLNGTGSWIYEKGVLVSTAVDSSGQVVGVAEGEWWRLITAAFLHYGPLHLGMNMLVLWFIGPPLEEYFGHGRYLLVYLVSGLAGLGGRAHLVAERAHRRRVGSDLGDHGSRPRPRGAQHLGVRRPGDGARDLQPRDHVLHPGDLDRRATSAGSSAAGLCALAFSSFRRMPALATLSMVGVGVLSVGLSVAQVA